MKFGRIITEPCVDVPPPSDPRCADAAFALSNPDICPQAPTLIVKPAFALACSMGSVQFKAFYLAGGVETDVTADSIFNSSNPGVALVGAISGNATGLSAGSTSISAAYLGLTGQSEFRVLGDDCCDDEPVTMMVVVDNSKSMSQSFSGNYATRLVYAKAAALRFISEVNPTKDEVGLEWFNEAANQVLSSPSSDVAKVGVLVASIAQTQQSTAFFDGLTAVVAELSSASGLKVLLLISDGEDQTASYDATNNPIALLSDFKAQGGVVICLGVRASGRGFNFLEMLATGGFFLNAYGATEAATLDYLSGLKGYICAGNCVPEGDEIVHQGALNYDDFENWDVTGGSVDLQGNGFWDFLPGNGLYVDLAGTDTDTKGKMQTKVGIAIVEAHSYRLSVEVSGNQRTNFTPNSVRLRVFYLVGAVEVDLLAQSVVVTDYTQDFQDYSFSFVAPASVTVFISIQQEQQPAGQDERIGLMLNHVTFEDLGSGEALLSGGSSVLLDDDFDDENPVYVPPRCGIGSYPTSVSDPDQLVISSAGTTSTNGSYTRTNETQFDQTGGTTRVQLIEDVWVMFDTVSEDTFYFCAPESFPTGPWSVYPAGDSPSPTVAYGQTTGFAHGYHCYGMGCLDSPPIAQTQDPAPLPDIEAGYPPPQLFTSTRQACATCPPGSSNSDQTNIVPVMTSAVLPSGIVTSSDEAVGGEAWKALDDSNATDWIAGTGAPASERWLQYQLPAAVAVSGYALTLSASGFQGPRTWEFQGSTNGSTWVTLDSHAGIGSFAGERKTFTFTNTTAYAYYRLLVLPLDSSDTQILVFLARLEMFGATAPVQVCKSATATSEVSQAAADSAAYADALALAQAELDCQPTYTSTQQFTAHCPPGSFGQPVTRSATRTSHVSLAEAEHDALADATAAAEAAKDCTLSNNDQTITIPDVGPGTPYPSVQHIASGSPIASIVVNLPGFKHNYPEDVQVLLVSPSGTKVLLMRNCGGSNAVASPINLVLDDAAGSSLPNSTLITAGTYKPSQYGVGPDFATTAPAGPYGTVLADFLGESPIGSWALWVQDIKAFDVGQFTGGWSLTIS